MHSHWISVTNIIIRFLGIIFSLVAFSLMASANNGAHDDSRISYASFSALKYVIAVNVVACLYSIIQVILFIVHFVSKGWIHVPTPELYYFTYFFDQVLAYLLFSCSSSGATAIDMIADFKPAELSGFYSNAAASVATSFMAFAVLGVSSLMTGYHLVKSG